MATTATQQTIEIFMRHWCGPDGWLAGFMRMDSDVDEMTREMISEDTSQYHTPSSPSKSNCGFSHPRNFLRGATIPIPMG